jgi:CheY-like chemotaxis protein
MNKDKNSSDPAGTESKTRLLLIVDGAASDSFYTSILLERLEYHIYAVKTAADALEVMKLSLPSLILTDPTLPGMSGIDLLKHVKRDPRTRSIPVIIHAREKNPEQEETCRREGCADYLLKPVDPNTLYASIQRATEPTPRRVIRFKTRLGVLVEDETATKRTGSEECITYLSEGGLYINTDDPQPPGTVLPLVFSLRDIKIRAEAIVLYSYSRTSRPLGEHGMGLKFLQISEEDKHLIRTFIKEQLTQNIAPKGTGSPPL